MADYNSDRTGSNIDLTLDKVDALDAKVQPTATGVDVTGTVTADGLTVDTGGTAVVLNHSATGPTLRFNNLDQTVADGQQLARIEFSTDDGGSTTDEAYLQLTATGGGGAADFDIMVGDGTPVKRARFGVGGDVLFYEDTGTTAKMVWDASAERLEIGDAVANDSKLVIRGGDYDPTTNGGMNSKGIGIRGGTAGLGNRTGAVTFSTNAGGANAGSAAISGVLEHASSDDVMGLAFFTHSSTTSTAPAAEAMRIDSAGNVGIGTDSPLNIGSGRTVLTLNNSASNFLNFGVSGVRTGGVYSDTTKTTILSESPLTFEAGGSTERARIDSSGNLLVGTTSSTVTGSVVTSNADFKVEGAVGHVAIGTGNEIIFSRPSTNYISATSTDANIKITVDKRVSFDRTDGNDGDIVQFQKEGATVGSIGSYSGQYLAIGNNTSGLSFIDQGTPHSIRPHNVTTNTSSDGLLNLGDSAARFKDLYLSHHLTLGNSNSSTIRPRMTLQRADAGGSGIFSTEVSGKAQQGMLYAIDESNGNYLIASLSKFNEANSIVSNTIDSSGLSLVATNAGGTIQLSSTASTVKMQVIKHILE